MAGSTRVVWGVYGLVATATVVTYSRVAPAELYHVSHGGIGGGLGRALVFLNFPVALGAILLALLAVDRLASRRAEALGVLSIVLCAVVVVPGVVDQADLDAKPVNVLPALGVALALALSLSAPDAGARLGRPRAAAVAALAVVSIPWLAAELGFHFGAGVFLAGETYEGHAAVHLGEHHGFHGVLLATTALVLWDAPARMRARLHTAVARVYLPLLLAYGLVNAANDLWIEQVIKRGWTAREIPDALHPAANASWLVIVLATAGLVIIGTWRTRRGWSSSASASTPAPTRSTPSSP